jgi:hypothetical protein
VEIKDDEDNVRLHKRTNRATKLPFGHCKASGWALQKPLAGCSKITSWSITKPLWIFVSRYLVLVTL